MAAKENEILHLLLQVFFRIPDLKTREIVARERECIKVRILRRQFRHNFEPGWKILSALCLLVFGSSPHLYFRRGGKYKQFNGRRRQPSLSQIVRQIKNLFFSSSFYGDAFWGEKDGGKTKSEKCGNANNKNDHTTVHQCVSCLGK